MVLPVCVCAHEEMSKVGSRIGCTPTDDGESIREPSKTLTAERREKLLALRDRERMKDVLLEKFERRYGPNREGKDNTNCVAESTMRDEVNIFVSKAKLTENNLARLERRMRQHACPKAGGSDAGSVVSAYSIATKQSGDITPRKAHTSNLTSIPEDSENIDQTPRDQTPRLLQTHYEWGMLDEHAKFLHELDEYRAKQGIADQQKILKRELDTQVAAQSDQKKLEQLYHQKYHEELMEEVSRLKDIDASKEDAIKEKQLKEKIARDMQMKYDRQIRGEEDEKKKRDEELFIRKIAVEVINQKDQCLRKKERDRQVFKNIILENEHDKKMKQEEAERQREKDLEYGLEYGRILDKQDAEKREEKRLRAERQKNREKLMDQLAADIQKSENDDAAKCARQRQEIESKLVEMETLKESKLRQQRKETQSFLLQQMQEKVERKAENKMNKNYQSKLLEEDSAEYIRMKNREIEDRRKRNVMHRLELERQMGSRKESKGNVMSEQEVAYNRNLLSKVDRVLQERLKQASCRVEAHPPRDSLL